MRLPSLKPHNLLLTAIVLLAAFFVIRYDSPVLAENLRTLETGINEMNQRVLFDSPAINDLNLLNTQSREVKRLKLPLSKENALLLSV